MKLIDRDMFISDMFDLYIKNRWSPRDIHFSLLDVRSNIDFKGYEVKAIPVEWIEKWINDRTKIWINPKYADMEFTEVPFDYYENFTPYQAISMLDDWEKENQSLE